MAVLVLTGCGDDVAHVAAPVPTATVTVTETVTPQVDLSALAELLSESPPPVPDVAPATMTPPPMIGLTVHTDGCGLIREDVDVSLYENLTWTILDADGFQVLGRNALGETRYRYFQGGTYTAFLEAWDGEKYAPVSEEVSLTC